MFIVDFVVFMALFFALSLY